MTGLTTLLGPKALRPYLTQKTKSPLVRKVPIKAAFIIPGRLPNLRIPIPQFLLWNDLRLTNISATIRPGTLAGPGRTPLPPLNLPHFPSGHSIARTILLDLLPVLLHSLPYYGPTIVSRNRLLDLLNPLLSNLLHTLLH